MFLNISRELMGVGPEDGTTFQVSSYGRRKKVLPGMVGEFQKKCVDLGAGETITMAELEGPGLITRIWMTVPRKINPGVLRNVSVRMYWDGECEPSVSAPLGDLFGATFSKPREYASAYLSITSGAYLCFFPMPFRDSARLTVKNESRIPVRMLFFQVTYLKLDRDLPSRVPYFHSRWHREELRREGPPFTILDAGGSGFYIGCHLDMQGKGYPWRANPVRIQMPEGFGMGMLEGWERIWIDGAAEPNVQGTGGEDYFNGAWYFTKVPSTFLTHGVTERRYDTRRVSCYRYHLEMPVRFKERVKVTIDHGINNLLPAVYDGCAFWYQDEPHKPFGELPPAGARRPLRTVRNRLVMAAPAAYLAAGFAAWIAVNKKKASQVPQ